jgi:excisionase family DNA binding protein
MNCLESEFGTLLGVATVAAVLGVSRATVINLVRRGDLPAARVGRQIKIQEHVVAQYLRDAGLNAETVGRGGGGCGGSDPGSAPTHVLTEDRPNTGGTVV